jgi:CRP/FNR family transcriptional regulator, nitrogen fixation regulation protein
VSRLGTRGLHVWSGKAEDRDAPAETLEVLFFRKGSTIYFEGEDARHWYEVLRGTIRTCRFRADGYRQLTNFFYRGDVFGVDEDRYLETAEAVTDVRVRKRSLSNGDEVPLRRALASAQRCIFLLGHKTAEQRLSAFLISGLDPADPSFTLTLPMSRADIADHLGLTIHTVSRTLSDMARRGLIEIGRPHTIRVANLPGLRAISGEEAFDFKGSNGHEALITGRFA